MFIHEMVIYNIYILTYDNRVLKDNKINGTLDVGSTYSNQLRLIDLENNLIDSFKQKDGVSNVNIM